MSKPNIKLHSSVPQMMVSALISSAGLCILFALLYHFRDQVWMRFCAISSGMVSYHLLIRFLSPVILTAFFHKKYDYQNRWFRSKAWEAKLYKLIKVKKWKKEALTYDPSEFSTKVHSFAEIANNMCHAELVHELIVLLSFTSLFFAAPFGAFHAFLINAVLAALFDTRFVILQRFNRPRVIRLMDRS